MINFLFKNKESTKQESSEKISFEEFIKSVEQFADNYMKLIKKRNIVYVGGDCEISRTPKKFDNVFVSITLYAKNKKGEWKRTSIEHKRKIDVFSDDIKTQNSLKSLLETHMCFKVVLPEKEKKL